jgi:hypothetical protein
MLKKSLLTLAGLFVLSSLACVAKADLGDTITTSQQKYGEPQKGLYEHELDYTHNQCRIEEYFNDAGICVGVKYFRLDGKPFSAKVNTHLDGANLPTWTLNANGNGWTKAPFNDTDYIRNTVEWTWTNGAATYTMINGQSCYADGWYYTRMYITPEGADVLMADVASYKQTHQPASEVKPASEITPAVVYFSKISIGEMVRSSSVA